MLKLWILVGLKRTNNKLNHNRRKSLFTLKLILCLVALLVLGLFFLYLGVGDPESFSIVQRDIFKNIAYALISSTIITAFLKIGFDYYLPEEIKNSMISSYDFFEVGNSIEVLHKNRPNSVIEEKIKESWKNIDIMITSLSSIRELDNDIEFCMKRSTTLKIRILCMDPNNSFFASRINNDRIYGLGIDQFKADISSGISRLLYQLSYRGTPPKDD